MTRYKKCSNTKRRAPSRYFGRIIGQTAFVAKAHRQSLAVAKGPHAKEDQDFIDAVSGRGET